MNIDYSLYLVSDRSLLGGRDLLQEIKKAIKGGVSIVQLREKEASSRQFYNLAMTLKSELGSLGVPLIINDRLDIALAVDADGLHIGQDDLPFSAARQLLGPDKIIGLSASSRAEAEEGARLGADYLGVGPLFATPTKADAAMPTGLALLAGLKKELSLPLVAIGGINLDNVAAIRKSGADGVAVVSALMGSDDIEMAARRILAKWQKG
ncbi:MAG: thiamine phosphate synthase [Syntrophomonadaceae bacterium]|nr:thiamine phosphate synthase [Syntrophomonadaceae bacterium]